MSGSPPSGVVTLQSQVAPSTLLRIVVVSDDDNATSKLLESFGGRGPEAPPIRRCRRLAEVVARLRAEAVDVVILDLSLPDSSGPSTYQRLADEATYTAIVVLAAGLDDPAARRCLSLGAEGILDRMVADPTVVEHAVVSALERHRAVERLRDSERRHVIAVRGAQDGILDWDLRSGLVYFSARWSGLLGEAEHEVVGPPDRWFQRVHPADVGPLRSVLEVHLAGGSRQVVHEHRVRSAAGDYRWVLLRALADRDLSGRPRRLAGCLTDITDRKRSEDRLVHDALHDDLTRLANRTLFLDRLEVSLAALRRNSDAHFAVLFVDLDRFKSINDAFGHVMGDKILLGLASRLQHFVRPGDTVARIGGDEFAVLLAHLGEVSTAVHVAERLLEVLALPFRIDGHEMHTTGSVGIALSRTGYRQPDELLHDADVAMYRAKSSGRGRCRVFDPDMHRSAVQQLKMESDLRESVTEGDFLMHYQPVIALETGAVVGFEGLVRWNHPQQGLVTPRQFLGTAEESGLIVPIGWWALEAGCHQIRDWQVRISGAQRLWLGINMSARALMRYETVERMENVLARTGVSPESLQIEVTEHDLLDHGDAAVSRIEELRSLGIRIGIDDFGTGQSSLTCVERFQFDVLKIDSSRTGALDNRNGGPRFVRSIVSLAADLGIDVIAEGVETESQLLTLRELECPLGQGFWFARPVGASGAEALLRDAPPRWCHSRR